MNYYIQGDAANAGKIRAAFEKLGINVLDFGFADKAVVYCSIGECVQYLPYSINLMNILYSHPDYKELELAVKPKFKVGDWVVTDYGKVSQVVSVDNAGDGYTLDDGVYFSGSWCDMYHLWTIADAKDGDILSAKIDGDDYILIFKQIKDGWIETYGHYYITIDKFCVPTQLFCRNYQGRLYPATQEQYRTLFKKMRDDGYEWDADKKELKKIQPHYDISNFKPFDRVLVRDSNTGKWRCAWFSYYDKTSHFPFVTTGAGYKRCIPFDVNKHLLGTTDMCPEEYINW